MDTHQLLQCLDLLEIRTSLNEEKNEMKKKMEEETTGKQNAIEEMGRKNDLHERILSSPFLLIESICSVLSDMKLVCFPFSSLISCCHTISLFLFFLFFLLFVVVVVISISFVSFYLLFYYFSFSLLFMLLFFVPFCSL